METPLKAKTALEKSAATREQSSASNSALSARSKRRSSGALATLVVGAFFATVASGSASAQTKSTGYVPGQLLVTFNVNPASNTAQRINSFAKASPHTTFQFIKTQLVTLPKGASLNAAMATYLGQSTVASVQPNYIYVATATPNDKLYKQQYAPKLTGMDRTWDFDTGSKDVVVAVVDTGVNYNHQDLQANMWRNTGEIPGNGIDDDGDGYIDDVYGIDALNGDSDPIDSDGHGTHVAGIIGAVGNNKTGVTGVNWSTRIMALKFLPGPAEIAAGKTGDTANAITCLQYVVRMKNRGVNIRVVNNSWGPLENGIAGVPADPALKTAFDNVGKLGILSVCSAGNQGVNTDSQPHFPSGFTSPGIISVAASDSKDRLADFSNFGPTSVDLSAPGVGILSTYPFMSKKVKVQGKKTTITVPTNSAYKVLSGTSMAAPQVSGAVALLATYYPNSSAQEIKDALLLSVDPIPSQAGKTLTGGRLNVARSIGLPDVTKGKKGKGGGGTAPTRPFPFPPGGGGGGGTTPTATGTGVTPTGTGTGVTPTGTGTGVTPTGTGTGVTPTGTTTPGGLPTASPTPTATATPIGQTPTPTPTPGPIVGKKNGPIVWTSDQLRGGGDRQVYKTTADVTFIGQRDNGADVSVSSVADFNPSVSLDTGKIAFTSNLPVVQRVDIDPDRNEIYVMDPNGANVTRLTNDNQQSNKPTNDQDTAITPNGNFVVFASKQGGQLNANDEVINGSGKNDASRFRFFIIPTSVDSQGFVPPKRLLLQGNLVNGVLDQDVRNATFSQDGTKIAFQSNIFGNWDIFMANFDQVAGKITSVPVQITNNPGDDVDPTFGPVTDKSPAGSTGRLAFASNRVANRRVVPNFNIFKLEKLQPETPERASTNPAIPVTDNFYQNYFFGQKPGITYNIDFSYSIPGDDYGFFATSYEAFVGFDDRGNPQYEVRNRDFFGAFEAGDEIHPTFSPDGTLIAYVTNNFFQGEGTITDDPATTNPDNDFDIFLVSADDSRLTNRLTEQVPDRPRAEKDKVVSYTGPVQLRVDAEPIWAADSTSATTPAPRPGSAKATSFGVTKAPVTFDSAVATSVGATTPIQLQGVGATDFAIVRNPENGVLRGEGATRTYTAIPGYEGPDQFTYIAKNALGQSEIATVKIDVKAPEMPRARIAETASSIADHSVTVTFANALDAATAANAQRYSVFVNGVPTDTENGQFSSIDNALTLTLPQGTLHKGDKVIVQWEKLRNFEGKALLNGKAQFTVR